jgi:hypothetical protein
MWSFPLNFRFNLNKSFATFKSEFDQISVIKIALQELDVWESFLLDEKQWFLACYPQNHLTKVFIRTQRVFPPKKATWSEKPGCGMVDLSKISDTILAHQWWWLKHFPEKLASQHIVLRTYNFTCMFGKHNHMMKGDECAQNFIECLKSVIA